MSRYIEESIYILSEQQKEICQELVHYDIFFSMVRNEYRDNPIVMGAMYNLFVHYYFEEQSVYNSELTMIYLLRHFVIERVRAISKFERIKMHTKGSYSKALIASALTINLFIDINRVVLKTISEQDLLFFLKYTTSFKELFNEHFEQYEGYPRKLVKIQTEILQQMRQYFNNHEKKIEGKIIEIIQFMDQYALDEKDIFERGILK